MNVWELIIVVLINTMKSVINKYFFFISFGLKVLNLFPNKYASKSIKREDKILKNGLSCKLTYFQFFVATNILHYFIKEFWIDDLFKTKSLTTKKSIFLECH